MASPRFSSSRKPHGRFLVALLLLMLGLAGLLAYQAQDAARSHRAAMEAALHDYAAFATWEYARRMQSGVAAAVHQSMHPVFEPGSHTVARSELPELAAFEEMRNPDGAVCSMLDSVDAFFRFDLAAGKLATSGRALPAAVERWIADTLSATLPEARRDGPVREAVVFGNVEGHALAVGYAMLPEGDGPGASALGFVAPVSAFASLCERSFPGSPLLPPSLTRGAPNDSLLSVAVTTGSGDVLCESPIQYASAFVAVDTLAAERGGLMVRITLRPEAAGSLLIGGLPGSRLPLLLGLLLLTAALVGAALVQLRREHELARLREDFVSGVSHELRTPLAQIRMFAETLLLGRARSEAERTRSLEIIDREARRLGQLVDNVLRFSGVERGSNRIAPEPVALAPLVRDVVEAFEPLARTRRVHLRAELEPGVAASVDRGALRQMLLNLLDNAVKYGPPGQTVTVGLHSVDDAIHLTVDDQGPGVPLGDRELVWTPFSRLERDLDAAVGGTGIGLAVVRELADLHGAAGWVEDVPGGGARFVLAFPHAWRRLDERTDRTADAGAAAGVA
jgi:signal transduction histidine kinase